MAKVRTSQGYRFVKELGGAVRRTQPSAAAVWLVEQGLASGRVLDFGCGFGFDAEHYAWDAFDPYYRQTQISGPYDTVICNHVLNMLTRVSRREVLQRIQSLMSDTGCGYLIVPRNIPEIGKLGPRKRIQNHVRLSLPVIYEDRQLAIFTIHKGDEYDDLTDEIECRM